MKTSFVPAAQRNWWFYPAEVKRFWERKTRDIFEFSFRQNHPESDRAIIPDRPGYAVISRDGGYEPVAMTLCESLVDFTKMAVAMGCKRSATRPWLYFLD